MMGSKYEARRRLAHGANPNNRQRRRDLINITTNPLGATVTRIFSGCNIDEREWKKMEDAGGRPFWSGEQLTTPLGIDFNLPKACTIGLGNLRGGWVAFRPH
jgi:hypothetical protein